MTLDTLQVSMTPRDAIALLVRVNDRGEDWCLIEETRNPEMPPARMAPKSIDLEILIDQSSTPHRITLNVDGTWTASTHIILGKTK